MRKKSFWVILLTAILFLSATVLGVSTVFRVDRVVIEATVVSEDAKDEAEALREKILEAYRGESSLFVEEEKAKEIFEEFPYFRMLSFKMDYPDKIVIKAAEDEEVYAVEKADGGYYILGADGVVLGERESPLNRSDGGTNVIVRGVTPTATRGEKISGDGTAEILSLCGFASLSLDGVRSNILSAEWQKPASSVTQITLLMKEGVKIVVQNPQTLTKEKAEAFVSFYLSLSDSQRLTGEIRVTHDEDGTIRVGYFAV